MTTIREGLAEIEVCEGVFYNSLMKLSRDLSVAVFKAYQKKLRFLDAFTATGIRGIRYALEARLAPSFLDVKQEAVDCCKRNLKRNGISGDVFKQRVDEHERTYEGVELDPFGSPAPFIKKGIELLEEGGVLSVTATDAMMLCGIQKEETYRFYGSWPLHNEFCHETGLRILMKKVAEEALNAGKGIMPLCSFYYRHQFKTIVEVSERHRENTEKNIRKASWRGKEYGPIWAGALHDKELLKKASSEDKRAQKYLCLFLEELDTVPFFYSVPAICRALRITPPKLEKILEEIKARGYAATRTHFTGEGFKSDAPFEEVVSALRKLSTSH